MEAIIIPIIFIIIAIISSVIKKNPEVKKFIDEIKSAAGFPVNKPAGASTQKTNTPAAKSVAVKKTAPAKQADSGEGYSSEGYDSGYSGEGIERPDMGHNLTEMRTTEYTSMFSRNEQITGTNEHSHPAETDSEIERYEPYAGSLGGASEGCDETKGIRFISNDPSYNNREAEIELTMLQKLIVFGDVINKPACKRRIR